MNIKMGFTGILFSLTYLHASAACVSLDYQEMKDMSKDQLVKEWCEVYYILREAHTSAIDAAGERGNTSVALAQQSVIDQCKGQSRRIARILETKAGPTQGLADTCQALKGTTKSR